MLVGAAIAGLAGCSGEPAEQVVLGEAVVALQYAFFIHDVPAGAVRADSASLDPGADPANSAT